MNLKQILQIILATCAVKGYQSALILEFCSGKSIKGYFEGSSSVLKLDGSSRVVQQWQRESGRLSCSCFVTPVSTVPNKLHVNAVYDTKLTVAQSCNKNVEVRDVNQDLKHVIGCHSEKIEIQDDDLDEGIQFKLNWFGDSETSDAFYLYITPEPGSVLEVSCHSPLLITTAKINVTGSPTSTTTFATTRQFVTAESTDSVVVIGVIVGLGLFFLICITCLLCFIARRKIKSEQMQKQRSSDQTISHTHTKVGRTLSYLYDKLKISRPLPSIPSSFRSIQPFKSRQQNRSGAYDSIKSSNSNARQVLDKQYSQSSDCSYLKPITITTISETFSNVNMKQEELNINQDTDATLFASTKEGFEPQNSNAGSTNDLYIYPQFVVETDNKQRSSTSLNIPDDRNSSKQTYVNFRQVEALRKDSRKLDNVGAHKDGTEVERSCSDYMQLDSSSVEEDSYKTQVDEENVAKLNINKIALIETDSSGYTPMSAICKINKKPVLEESDSIFPQLISFTPSHEAEVTDSQNKENNIVKTKRYVKDKKIV